MHIYIDRISIYTHTKLHIQTQMQLYGCVYAYSKLSHRSDCCVALESGSGSFQGWKGFRPRALQLYL